MRLLLIVLWLFSFALCGQIKTNITVSDKYAKRLKKTEKPDKRLKKLKKLYKKDSLRYLKELDKVLDKKYDSLFNPVKYSNPDQYSNLVEDFKNTKKINLDSLDYYSLTRYTYLDKEQWIDFEGIEMYGANEIRGYSSTLDPSELSNKLSQEAESRAIQNVNGLNEIEQKKREFSEYQHIHDDYLKKQEEYRKKIGQYKDRGKLRKQALKKAKATNLNTIKKAKEKLDKKLSKSHFSGKLKLSKLKKKYSRVLDFNDLSSATRRNSLSHLPIKKRFIWGGNLEVNIGDPTTIDFSPTLAYRINKLFSAGIGGNYRANFGEDIEFWEAFDQDVYGYRVFSEYVVVKDFFVHGEYESLNTWIKDANGEKNGREWVNGLLLGIGKNYTVMRQLKGNVMVLYDFIHSSNSPHRHPWVVRFGFNWQGAD